MNRKGPRLLFHGVGDSNIMFHPIMWVESNLLYKHMLSPFQGLVEWAFVFIF